MIIGKHLEKLAKGHTISFHQKIDGLPNHFLFSGPNRRSMRMACFMKKMRYLEKNMRDGLAWSGSEVTDSAMKMCQKWLAHDLPFSRSRLVLLNLIGKRSCLDQRMITSLYNQLSSFVLKHWYYYLQCSAFVYLNLFIGIYQNITDKWAPVVGDGETAAVLRLFPCCTGTTAGISLGIVLQVSVKDLI